MGFTLFLRRVWERRSRREGGSEGGRVWAEEVLDGFRNSLRVAGW